MSAPEETAFQSEEDVIVWLSEQSVEHNPGDRRTDSELPEPFWELADKVAGQREVTSEDAIEVTRLYEDWQNALNEADVLADAIVE
jgi:hypothetical protein